jgi:deoxyribodipyrimidine photo-lyase
MRTAVVLFNRDLRVHDHPALARAAREAERVVPLFVLDDRLLASRYAAPNRLKFMLDSLHDLDAALRDRGAGLVIRRGAVVKEAIKVAQAVKAEALFTSGDVSAYAQRRESELARACEEQRLAFEPMPGVTIVPAGDLSATDGDHFKVFTPYWRRWSQQPLRAVEPAPRRLALPGSLAKGRIPKLGDLANGDTSPELPGGGEQEARRRLAAWNRSSAGRYDANHDDLAGDATSRLSPYLHFGCISPREALERTHEHDGDRSFARQLCWRDFHHQVTAAFPELPRRDYRARGDRWRDDEHSFTAWKEGRTGYPIVDAGMRQLRREGWMHNRARLITASFLTKDLYVDWRHGAWHFWDLLADGDIANNAGNWQWVAGTGNDTRPNRMFNPITQAKRFDPEGDYVRRYVPELAHIDGRAVHEPWKLGPLDQDGLDYPEPIVEHDEAAGRFRKARAR